MFILTVMYAICAIRTNTIFLFMLTGLSMAEALLAASYWTSAKGHPDPAMRLQVLSGQQSFFIP